MRIMLRHCLLLVILLGLIVSCSGQTSPTPVSQPDNKSYPSPAGPQGNQAYPAAQTPVTQAQDGYPASQSTTALIEGPVFTLKTPLTVASTEVCGTGGANVPIKLVNVSRNADVLGQTVVDSQGSFCIPVQQPLPSAETIGIVLGNIAGTAFKQEQFLRSSTYTDIPQIGTIFVMTEVK